MEALHRTGISEDQVQRQLISLQRIITSRDKMSLNHLVKNSDIDLSLPLKGVTPLSLSLYLRYSDMTRELLSIMEKLGQIARAVNVTSTDNSGRRETPVVTAARMGQISIVEALMKFKNFVDLEARDGQGRTALWHAVKEEQLAIVMLLVENGAKVYYVKEDMACPLQLACRGALQKRKVKHF